ncbi:MAG TPA: nitrite/sulfite reductase [Candidatus Dormibacteraeota bacterium]|jgi:sulfite reductase beta subunit-like hemoprotein|nr:nitrite/sulfite reductase [Candidatus Dormibacteraeota bacterium]
MSNVRTILPPQAAEIDEFERESVRFQAGEWDPNEFIGYRTSRGVYGQRQADEQMIRIKVPLGILSADQMDVVGDIAEKYTGMGRAHLTTRENFQIHFTKLDDVATIMRDLADAGLTTREACGNTVRNVTGAPLAGVCPREPFDTTPYAVAYARHFLRHPVTQKLPRKFKTSFSCCDQDDAISGIHDLGFVPMVVDGVRGFRMTVGGGTAIFQRVALLLSEFVPMTEFLKVSEAVLRVFNQCDELRVNRQRARLKFHVHKVGIDVFRQEVEDELAKPWAQDWHPIENENEPEQIATALGPIDDGRELTGVASSPTDSVGFTRWVKSNVVPQKQEGFRAVTVKVPVGNLSPTHLREVAKLSRTYAAGEVRTTPQQNLVLRWVREDRLPQVHAALVELGLGNRANVLTDVTSCPGTDSCKLGVTGSMQLAERLPDEIADLEDEVLGGLHIKISGCPNGCGQHHIADIGLEGASTKVGSVTLPCYHLYLGGEYTGGEVTSGDGETLIGARAGIRLPAKNVPDAVRLILLAYRQDRNPDEDFRPFVDRMGPQFFKDILAELMVTPVLGPDTVHFFQDFGRDTLFQVERGEGECMV